MFTLILSHSFYGIPYSHTKGMMTLYWLIIIFKASVYSYFGLKKRVGEDVEYMYVDLYAHKILLEKYTRNWSY